MAEITTVMERLQAIERRYEELSELMGQTEVATDPEQVQTLAKEQSSLEDLVGRYRTYQATDRALADAQSLLDDANIDPELAEMARQEIDDLQVRREAELQHLMLALLPSDPNDQKNVIVEIRAGVGGEEAALWAAELYRMYTRYAENKRWQVEIISASESDTGGFKEIIFEIRGRGAYSRLKYESGPHRVQRVPATEAQGRIHTSTATVAVLPEADEVELDISPNEVRIDIFHSGGAGGQNVNKVSTAVRLTHIPTGIVVVCQDERSQLRNRNKAMTVLRSRLLSQAQQKQSDEVTQTRRSQIGTGERAEKIRTYNFPQNRLTDHRVNLTWHNLNVILDGELDTMIDAVATAEQARQIEEQWE